MARFDVYRNPDGPGYLLDIQADLLSHLATRVVIPLLPQSLAPPPLTTLNPVCELAGEDILVLTQALAAVPAAILKTPVASLAGRRDELTAAVDLLFQGF